MLKRFWGRDEFSELVIMFSKQFRTEPSIVVLAYCVFLREGTILREALAGMLAWSLWSKNASIPTDLQQHAECICSEFWLYHPNVTAQLLTYRRRQHFLVPNCLLVFGPRFHQLEGISDLLLPPCRVKLVFGCWPRISDNKALCPRQLLLTRIFFLIFRAIHREKRNGEFTKMSVDQQFLKLSSRPVWHRQSRKTRSQLHPQFSVILMLCLDSGSNFSHIHNSHN